MQAETDRAVANRNEWLKARHASLLLCRVQQRLESRMMANTGIPGIDSESAGEWTGKARR
jgi:hypothetical protein